MSLVLQRLVQEHAVEARVRRGHFAGGDHPLDEDLGTVEERPVLEHEHAVLLLARHQVADLALLQHAHVQERRLGGEDVRHAVLVEQREALVGERSLLHPLGEGVGIGVPDEELQFAPVRRRGEGVHERRLPGEEVAHDADVEVHDFAFSFSHESRSVTVRLNTSAPGFESSSDMK